MALVKTLTAEHGTAWSNLRKNLGRNEMKHDSSWWCPSCTRYAMPTWKPAVQLSAEAPLPWSEDHRPVAALPIGVADRYRYSLWWTKFGLATLCWSNSLFHSCRLLQHSYSGSTPWFSPTCCFDCFSPLSPLFSLNHFAPRLGDGASPLVLGQVQVPDRRSSLEDKVISWWFNQETCWCSSTVN